MEKIKRLGQTIQLWTKNLLASPKLIPILLQICTIIILLFYKFFYFTFIPERPDFSNKAALKKVCYLAMKSILDQRPSVVLFDKGLVPQIEEDRDKFFDFIGGEKIYDVMKKGNGRCVAVITDKRGTRYFSFTFKESAKWRHIYGHYIVQIDEILSHDLGRLK